MNAIVLSVYGDVDKLVLRELPNPRPGPGEIVVRMAGASINPIDWKLRSGKYTSFMPLSLPAVLGRDVSGMVVEVGPGVTAFAVGARVLGLINGGYAELVVAPVACFAEVPEGMDLIDAAALPLVLLTGAQLIEEALAPKEGEVVLVTGAVGSVGRVAVFAAKARGARVWAGVRNKQRAAAMELGADGVVALDDDAGVGALPQLSGIADTVGGTMITGLYSKLKAGGTIASVVGEPPGAKQRGFVVRGMLAHPDAGRLSSLVQAVAEGRLVIPVARHFPLAEAAAAQELAEKGAIGKVVLTS